MANYEISPGTIYGDYSSLSGWTVSGTAVVDSSIKKTSTATIKLTASSGAFTSITRTISDNLSSNNLHGFMFYVDDYTKITSIAFYLSNDSSFVNYYSCTISNSSGRIVNGWNYVVIRKSDWSATGSPDWNTTFTRQRIRINSNVSGTCNVNLDSYYINPYSRPKILFTFDDVPDTAWTEGYSYLNSKKMKGTFYACGGLTDTSGFMTTLNLKEAYSSGWDVANHTYDHLHLDQISDNDIKSQLTRNEVWLRENGFERGSGHVAYPYGGYNNNIIDIEKTLNFKTARSSDLGTMLYQINSKGLNNPFALKVVGIDQTQSLATIKDLVNTTIQTGGTMFMVLHRLVSSSSLQTEWNISDFQALVDYIYKYQQGGQLDVVTITEWYNGLTNPRKIV